MQVLPDLAQRPSTPTPHEPRLPNSETVVPVLGHAELLTGITAQITKVELAVGGSRDPAQPGDPDPPFDYPEPAKPDNTALYSELFRVDTEFGAIGTVAGAQPGDPPRASVRINATLAPEIGGPVVTLREAGLIMTKLEPGEGGGEVVALYNHVVFGGPITKNPELQMTLSWEVMF